MVLPTLGSAPAVPCLFPCCLRWRKGGRKRDAEELALVCEHLFEGGAGVRPGRRSEFTGKHICILLLLSGVKSVDELPLRISVRLSSRAWFSGLPRPAPFLPGRVNARASCRAGSSALGSPLGRSRHSSSQSDLSAPSSSSSGLSFTACMSDFSLYVFHPYGAGKQKTTVSGLTPGPGGLGMRSASVSSPN